MKKGGEAAISNQSSLSTEEKGGGGHGVHLLANCGEGGLKRREKHHKRVKKLALGEEALRRWWESRDPPVIKALCSGGALLVGTSTVTHLRGGCTCHVSVYVAAALTARAAVQGHLDHTEDGHTA